MNIKKIILLYGHQKQVVTSFVFYCG